jgi:hypothetical protein
MNSKGRGKKRSWPNLMFHPGTRLEGLSKTTKTCVMIAGLWAKIFNQGPPKYETGVANQSTTTAGWLGPKTDRKEQENG